MSASSVVTTLDSEKASAKHGQLYWAFHDGFVVTWRNVMAISREPELIFFSIIQPIIFIVLFAYVFGGAIQVPGGNYKNFLLPGVFVQTIAFAGAATSVGMSEDMTKGIIDRFRSLPMARSAVLTGRTLGDLLRAILTIVIMSITGLAIGWRITSSFGAAVAAYALLLAFGYAMSWIGCYIGLSVPNPEVASTAGLVWLFPLTFVSNAFVPTQSMPSWLQPIAEWNPISSIVAAERQLFGGAPMFTPGAPFPEKYGIPLSIGWIALILVIFVPLAVRKYRMSGLK